LAKFSELFHKNYLFWDSVYTFLSFLNRFFEILKWKNLTSWIGTISLYNATAQVLSALTAGIFTPNGVGEYAGKALYFNKKWRRKLSF